MRVMMWPWAQFLCGVKGCKSSPGDPNAQPELKNQ